MCLLNFRFTAVVVGGAIATNVLGLGVRAGFRSTKLSIHHKS